MHGIPSRRRVTAIARVAGTEHTCTDTDSERYYRLSCSSLVGDRNISKLINDADEVLGSVAS
jgi:hypothetical protein